MSEDEGLRIVLAIKKWQGLKPHFSRYETYGGYHVIAIQSGWFWLQINYR